jgi:chemotaxis protein histidine kinase CheA
MINAILREPAREESAFKKKLDSIFRQVHSIKGESSALGLTSIEARAHSFEEDLQALREKRSGLSGNDFLPLIVKLDDLLTHMQSIRDLVSRLSRLQLVTREPVVVTREPVAPMPASSAAPKSAALQGANDMVPMLEQLTERVAAENGRTARLECLGLAELPAAYRRMVKDISVQAIRNAVVHGIEPAAARTSAGKSECGLIRIQLQPVDEGGYKLTLEDDGQGLQTERIIATAKERGLISAEEASTVDNRLMVKLLFRAGFSTATQTTADAGRGVGMNAIADLVQTAGGRISVSTAPGRYTRLSITLPALQQDDTDTEAA